MERVGEVPKWQHKKILYTGNIKIQPNWKPEWTSIGDYGAAAFLPEYYF